MCQCVNTNTINWMDLFPNPNGFLLSVALILRSTGWNVYSTPWNVYSSPWNVHSTPWNIKINMLLTYWIPAENRNLIICKHNITVFTLKQKTAKNCFRGCLSDFTKMISRLSDQKKPADSSLNQPAFIKHHLYQWIIH